MALVGIKTNFSNFTEHIIVAWALASNPLAEVGQVTLPYPNVNGQVTPIANLVAADYLLRFYLSIDGTTKSGLYDEWPVAVKETKQAITPYYYTVDGGPDMPVSGDAIFPDARLKGKTFVLFRRGLGHLNPVTNYTNLNGGGWSLDPADAFAHDEEWLALVTEEVEGNTNTITTDYSGVNVVTDSGNFTSDYKSKHNVAAFATDTIGTTAFPSFLLIGDSKAKFSTFATSARYWVLQFATGDYAEWNGQQLNRIVLRKGWMVELVWIGGACYVTDFKGCPEKVGVPFPSTYIELNCLPCDGSEYDIADYAYLIDALPLEMRVSYPNWNQSQSVTSGAVTETYYPNRGKFAVDVVSGKFRVPSLGGQSMRFLKTFADSTMLAPGAGGMWPQQLLKHRHKVATTGSSSNNQTAARAIKRNDVQPDPPYDGEGTYHFIEETGSDEQTVKSTGFYAIVHI